MTATAGKAPYTTAYSAFKSVVCLSAHSPGFAVGCFSGFVDPQQRIRLKSDEALGNITKIIFSRKKPANTWANATQGIHMACMTPPVVVTLLFMDTTAGAVLLDDMVVGCCACCCCCSTICRSGLVGG